MKSPDTTAAAAPLPQPIAEPVGVLGVGVEGRATIAYLRRLGISRIEALDQRPIDGLPQDIPQVTGEAHLRDLARFATLFKSPGIRPDIPALVQARAAGVTVTSALSHFLTHCPARVFGITGTLGKGTAASILAAGLSAQEGARVHLGGNIGNSPLEFLPDVGPADAVVLEISSFQAMDIAASPHVAGILRTTSEHLDWHVDTAEYRAAKAHLLHRQTADDWVVYCADAPGSCDIAATSAAKRLGYSIVRALPEGLFVRGDQWVLRRDGAEQVLPMRVSQVQMAGRFNLENIAAALLLALLAGADPKPLCDAAARFPGLPHRLELRGTVAGTRYYNDSYATRPDATIAAVNAFAEPLSLILGGSEKNADFSELVRALFAAPHLRQVVRIGATAPRLEAAIAAEGVPAFALDSADTLDAAVDIAAAALPAGGVVLLSPACASFGMFQNYKVRGEAFGHIVSQRAAKERRP